MLLLGQILLITSYLCVECIEINYLYGNNITTMTRQHNISCLHNDPISEFLHINDTYVKDKDFEINGTTIKVDQLRKRPKLETSRNTSTFINGKDFKVNGTIIAPHQLAKRYVALPVMTNSRIQNKLSFVRNVKPSPQRKRPYTDSGGRQGRYTAPVGTWATSKLGTVPSNVFMAGIDYNGEKMYVGRGTIPKEKSIVPGLVSETHNSCVRVAWKGWGRCLRKFEFLVGNNYNWVVSRKSASRPDAIPGGADEEGPLFVCRHFINEHNVTSQLVIGKVLNTGFCYVNLNGHELFFSSYFELLVIITDAPTTTPPTTQPTPPPIPETTTLDAKKTTPTHFNPLTIKPPDIKEIDEDDKKDDKKDDNKDDDKSSDNSDSFTESESEDDSYTDDKDSKKKKKEKGGKKGT